MGAPMIDSPYGRDVREWIGKTPNSMPPPKVRQRVFDRKSGRCHACGRKINGATEKWTCEHLIAVINAGENRERGLDLTCSNCLPAKNAADVAEKSLIAKKRSKHLGTWKAKYRPMDGSRGTRYRKRMDGRVELR